MVGLMRGPKRSYPGREYQELMKAFHHFAESPDGKIIMEYLRIQYGEAVIDTHNPTSMADRVGARNVYLDMLNLSREVDDYVFDEE